MEYVSFSSRRRTCTWWNTRSLARWLSGPLSHALVGYTSFAYVTSDKHPYPYKTGPSRSRKVLHRSIMSSQKIHTQPGKRWRKWLPKAKSGILVSASMALTYTFLVTLYSADNLWYSFNIRRIQNLTANPLKIRPAINQVELSYWNPQPELLKVWFRYPFTRCGTKLNFV